MFFSLDLWGIFSQQNGKLVNIPLAKLNPGDTVKQSACDFDNRSK